jgi:hypothetical protein
MNFEYGSCVRYSEFLEQGFTFGSNGPRVQGMWRTASFCQRFGLFISKVGGHTEVLEFTRNFGLGRNITEEIE